MKYKILPVLSFLFPNMIFACVEADFSTKVLSLVNVIITFTIVVAIVLILIEMFTFLLTPKYHIRGWKWFLKQIPKILLASFSIVVLCVVVFFVYDFLFIPEPIIPPGWGTLGC